MSLCLLGTVLRRRAALEFTVNAAAVASQTPGDLIDRELAEQRLNLVAFVFAEMASHHGHFLSVW